MIFAHQINLCIDGELKHCKKNILLILLAQKKKKKKVSSERSCLVYGNSDSLAKYEGK